MTNTYRIYGRDVQGKAKLLYSANDQDYALHHFDTICDLEVWPEVEIRDDNRTLRLVHHKKDSESCKAQSQNERL